MKKSISILVAIGLVFLIIGSVYNFQKGLTLDNDFWRLRRDGRYTHGKDSISYTPDSEGGHFDVILNGESITVDMTQEDDSLYMEFSNGWAVELTKSDLFSIKIGGILLSSDYTIIPLDFEAMGCRFEKAAPVVSETFYDENDRRLGQWHTLQTESGEFIDSWEVWDDPEGMPEAGTVRRETMVITEGEPLPDYEQFGILYVNAEGEYLMNPNVLFNIENGYENTYRVSIARLLREMATKSADIRGHAACLFMFLLFYCLGAAQWLWPEDVTFFGSRWKFKGDPELSDEGLMFTRFGAACVMIVGIVMLFIPVFA